MLYGLFGGGHESVLGDGTGQQERGLFVLASRRDSFDAEERTFAQNSGMVEARQFLRHLKDEFHAGTDFKWGGGSKE